MEFVCRAWDIDEATAKQLVGRQTGNGIIKVDGGVKMPEPNKDQRNGMALNCLDARLDVDIKGGGRVVVLNTKNLPLVGESNASVKTSKGEAVDGIQSTGVPTQAKQCLYSLDYEKSAACLELEFDISCKSAELKLLESLVLSADWEGCIDSLYGIRDMTDEQRDITLFLVSQQFLLESLG
ncbi:hypothetical protein L6452_01294 [Arctium lappa]|uniref:Uncharacterized protein n=1 Tax=Arctium lappa TaxID=4217 RepID=A0ACB9FHJ8_ARCLA|nr:hypothetical protein L6452_01294 [Arctium lappa]